MVRSVRKLWEEIAPNVKWDAIKISGAAMIGSLGYLIHKWHRLPDWSFGVILFVAALVIFLLAMRQADVYSLPQKGGNTGRAEVQQDVQAKVMPQEAQRLTIRITNGFVGRKQNEWTTVLLLLEVKVDGPPAKVVDWQLHLRYDENAKAFYHESLDSTKTRLEYVPAGDRNVYDVNAMPTALPDRGWLVFGRKGESDEFLDHHVFGGTFVLAAVEHDGRRSTLQQAPGFCLNRADIIQWSDVRG